MNYFSKKLNKDITPKEILSYADTRKINYVKARCELQITEIPTPAPKKHFRNISNNDIKFLAVYGIVNLGLKL
jgi:hypothetical protein